MKKPQRLSAKKLTVNRETIRALARIELAAAAGGFDTADPCVAARLASKDPYCG